MDRDPFQSSPVLPAVNQSAEDVPPFAAVRVTGTTADGVRQVGKPNATDDPGVFLNGAAPIAKGGGRGTISFEPLFRAAFDATAGTPAEGDDLGSVAGQWPLRKGRKGFKAVGGTDGTTVGVARVGVGGGADPCGPGLLLQAYPTGFACDGYGSSFGVTYVYKLITTGCGTTPPFNVAVSGKVVNGSGVGVAGVSIYGSTADPNAGPPNSVVIATTDADGNWAGQTRAVIDADPVTPVYYVSVTAGGGYSPNPARFNNNSGPIGGINFHP